MAKLVPLKKNLYSLLLAFYLLASSPKPLRAEDSVSYKYEDYQEDNDRIRVRAHYMRAEKDLGINTSLSFVGLIDTITGSSPTGVPIQEDNPNQVPLEELEDRRKSGVVAMEHKKDDHTFSFELSYSDESDYLSQGGAVSYKRELNKNNTTLLIGYSHLDDELTAPTLRVPEEKKSHDFLVGVAQVVDSATVLTFNLGYGQENGYLGDPYKGVQKTVEILPDFFLPIVFPENRPGSREKWTFFSEVIRDMEKLKASLQASHRFFTDDAGIDSHTWTLEWYQKLSDSVILRPMIRYYRQSAADFYFYDLDTTDIIPDRDSLGSSPFYASDHRLSKMETITFGAKLIWFINDDWEVDLSYNRYKMNGLDGTTHPSAYSDADITSIGGRWWF